MSQAFIRESDDMWLSDVPPTLSALTHFLTRENNGIRVSEREILTDKNGRELYKMSNGLTYGKDGKGRWEVVGD